MMCHAIHVSILNEKIENTFAKSTDIAKATFE